MTTSDLPITTRDMLRGDYLALGLCHVPSPDGSTVFGISCAGWDAGAWWERAMLDCMLRGHAVCIGSLDGKTPYLLRGWLSTPIRKSTGDHETWDSSNSRMLHCFFRGDDDRALHDHPWDFETTILAGGYHEARPPTDWLHPMPWEVRLGPPMNYIEEHHAGDILRRRAHNLHSIVRLAAQRVWTMVRTGPSVREWGFHPPGKTWQPWRAYLDAARATAATVPA